MALAVRAYRGANIRFMTTLDDYLSSPEAPNMAAFARQCGCSRSHLRHLRLGERQPSLKLALRIERVTGEEVPVESWVPAEERQEAA